MARTGWSTSNFLRYGGAPLTAVPLTMMCRAWDSVVTGANQILMGLFLSTGADRAHQFHLKVHTTAGAIAALTGAAAGTNDHAVSTANISANTWFTAAGVWAAINDRRAFLNGANKGTNTTSITPVGINRTSIGVQDGSSQLFPFAPSGTGHIAEAGIWNIAFSDADVLAASKAESWLVVHPEALVAYWPLWGSTSPEINYKSNAAVMTMQGTLTASPHPRIIMPRRRTFFSLPSTFKAPYARNANSIIGAGASP